MGCGGDLVPVALICHRTRSGGQKGHRDMASSESVNCDYSLRTMSVLRSVVDGLCHGWGLALVFGLESLLA